MVPVKMEGLTVLKRVQTVMNSRRKLNIGETKPQVKEE